MAENFANLYQTTLNGAISSTSRPITFTVTSVTGAPVPNFRIRIDDEILLISSISGNDFTGNNVEGTTAATHANSSLVTHVLTAGAIDQTFVDRRYFIRADSTRTFTSNTNAQNIFTSPANGRLTLETGVYRFHGLLIVTAMSGTSGNAQFDWLGGGNATVTHWLWHAWGVDATADVATTVATSRNATNISAASIINVGTGTGLTIQVDGSFDVTGAGTLVPTMKMVTAASSVLSLGSFLMFERLGASGVVSSGPWD